jgi:hypothetical protein
VLLLTTGIFLLAELHRLQDVQEAAERFLENHFLQVVSEGEFQRLEWRHLIHLLHSELLKVDSEAQVSCLLIVVFTSRFFSFFLSLFFLLCVLIGSLMLMNLVKTSLTLRKD